jgi:hypothetical protein
MKTRPDALGTVENEFGSAKHKNGTWRARYRRKCDRERKIWKQVRTPSVPPKTSMGACLPLKGQKKKHKRKTKIKPWELEQYNPCTTRTVLMSSQYFDTANHKKSQCDFVFKADQVPKLWATTWSSQGLCQLLTSNQLLTKSPSWIWIESQFHKTDQVSKLWAIIWLNLDLYQLLISNQLLIKSNPNKHQYKSNWCLIRVVSTREIFGRDTELPLRNWDLFRR